VLVGFRVSVGNVFGRIIGVENSDRNEFSSCVISPHAVSSFDEIIEREGEVGP